MISVSSEQEFQAKLAAHRRGEAALDRAHARQLARMENRFVLWVGVVALVAAAAAEYIQRDRVAAVTATPAPTTAAIIPAER